MNSSAARRWLLDPHTQLALFAVLATASEMCLKRGALDTAHLPRLIDWLGVSALASPWVWLGIVLQLAGFGSWIAALRRMPLHIAFALMSVLHVSIPLGSWFFFGEKVSGLRWAGIALVLAGICVIARPASRLEEQA